MARSKANVVRDSGKRPRLKGVTLGRPNRAIKFLEGDDSFADYTAHDKAFVALLLKNNQNLERTARDMGMSYGAARHKLKDVGVCALLGWVMDDFNALAKYGLPRIFEQALANATFDPRPLMKAARQGAEAFEAALDALTPAEAASIQEWSIKGGEPVVKYASRVQSLDLLFRFFSEQKAAVQDTGRQALGIQVILRAPDGSTTEVRALTGAEASG